MTRLPATPIPKSPKMRVSAPQEQATWLMTKIDESIKYVQKTRSRFQRIAGSVRVIILILSGLVTVSLGIRWEEYADVLRNAAFAMGALTTTLGSLDLYFNYRGLWIEHEEAEWRFHRLKDRIEFYLQGNAGADIEPEVLAGFHEAYQWIWDNLSTNWLSQRRNSRVK